MSIQLASTCFAARFIRTACPVMIALLGLMVCVASTAGAQQPTTYLLNFNGQNVQIDSIAFGSPTNSQPESGAATLRMRAANGESPLSQLAETRSQPQLFLQFRDPQSNGIVHYEFDDVKFGRVRQIGQGANAMDSVEITYTSFKVNAPGSVRKTTGKSFNGNTHRANPSRSVRNATRKGVRKPHIKQLRWNSKTGTYQYR